MIEAILFEIAKLLEDGGEDRTAAVVREAVSSSGEDVSPFLVSDELWGGSGSIADQSLVSDDARRRSLEDLMVKLGRVQLSIGKVNPRTEMWVHAFEQWQRADTP